MGPPSGTVGGVGELPVRHMQTVLPTLHHGADDLEVVAENCPLGVEAVLHQELQQAVGEHFVPGVTLDCYRTTNRTSEWHFSHVCGMLVCLVGSGEPSGSPR